MAAPLTLLALPAADAGAAAGSTLHRATDPVVLTGASLPKLLGAAPGRIGKIFVDDQRCGERQKGRRTGGLSRCKRGKQQAGRDKHSAK